MVSISDTDNIIDNTSADQYRITILIEKSDTK